MTKITALSKAGALRTELCYITQPHLYRPGGEWYFWLISYWEWRSDCLIEMGAPLK